MEFSECLDNLQSNDNAVRQAAEQQWNLYKSDPIFIMSNIMGVMESADVGRRSLVVILLRGLVLRESSVLEALPLDVFDQLRQSMLTVMVNEPLPFVRRQIAYAVAPLAQLKPWPALLSTLPQLASSSDPSHHALCFFLIDKLAEYIGPFLVESSNLAVICAMLEPVFASNAPPPSSSFTSPHNLIATQAAAACASLSLLHELPDGDDRSAEETSQHQKMVAATLPFALHLLQLCMSSDDVVHMGSVSESLGRLVKARPLLFKETWAPLLQTVSNACVGSRAGAIDDPVKCVLLEMLTDLMTGRESARFCCNEQSRAACLSMCISMLSRVEVAEDVDEEYLWEGLPASEDAFGDEDGEECDSSVQAGNNLSIFLRKWPIQETLAHCHAAIGSLFQDGGYSALRAALLLTSMLFDLLGTEMQQHLPALVPMLVTLTEHSHPRLRLCALLCFKSLVLSEYDEDEEEGFRENFHEVFFPLILKSIGDNMSFPKLACQGINTLRAFCDPQTCPQILVLPHTQSILEMAWVLLSKREDCPVFLLEECLPLIGNISIIDRDSFAPHYANFMSILLAILMAGPTAGSTSSGGERGGGCGNGGQQELKGRCLECCALMGTSVGYDIFLPDATQLLEFMIALQSDEGGGFDFSDPLASYIVQACARIAGVLRNTFEPYLQRVMPVLLQHIAQEIEHTVQTEEQFSGCAGGDDDYVTIYQRGTGNIRFFNNSHAMKEKELSLRTLYQYMLDIPRLMVSFVPDILGAVSHISPVHCCSEDNTDSLTIIGAIISDACKLWLRLAPDSNQTADALGNMFASATSYNLTTLQEANKLSSAFGNLEFSAAAVDNVRLTLLIFAEKSELTTTSPIPLDIGKALFLGLRDQIHMWITRKYESEGGEGVADEQEQQEEDLWLGLTDSVGHLFRSMSLADSGLLFQEDVLPFFVPLFPASEHSAPLQSLIISMLTDAVEAFAANVGLCHSVIEMLAPFLFRCADQEGLTILCMYGIGTCALHGAGSSAWEGYANKASSLLQHYLKMSLSGEKEEEEDYDEELKGTIVSALFKVAISHDYAESLLAEVLQSLLPLACFPYEARECHGLLLDQMAAGNPRLLGGASGGNLPTLFSILAQLAVLYAEALNLLSPSSSSSTPDSDRDRDDSDFWNEQLVAENFQHKVQLLFAGDHICGFNRDVVLSLLQSLPVEHQQALFALLPS